ncbi:MAG: M60 family metallopeptidase [Prevotellaceae bacterium]|nr:M60 family metallopeptidase [Prevotellaceae bacterium]
MNKRILMSLWALMACAIAYCATPATGYYRVLNVNSQKALSEDFMTGRLSCTDKGGSKDYEQMWQLLKVSGTYRICNIYTGRYIQLQSANSQAFTTGTGTASFTITEVSGKPGTYLIKGGNYMHCDNSNNVVGWYDTNNAGNQWTVESVNLTSEEITAAREDFKKVSSEVANADAVQQKLETFFADAACTTLKSEYRTMSDDALKAAMSQAGLSEFMQNMAVKVKNDTWSTADDHTYAKEFRVRSYTPFSDVSTWHNILSHHAYSYMSNPTGIYGDAKDVIYVFVGSDTPAGATLYLQGVVGNELIGSRRAGTQLHKGLNIVVTSRPNTIYYILYTVETAEGGKKIADYPNIDIHIEGGFVNGFYDNTDQNNAKYKYLLSKATNNNIFIVRGERTVFSFSKEAYTRTWPNEVNEAIKWYDKVANWEEDLMGFTTAVAKGEKSAWPNCVEGGKSLFPEYCNNFLFALQGADGTNPNASTYRTSYPGVGGIESSFNAYRENFDNWCAGHEVGHQHQRAINLEGCTEVSNNFFSGVVTYQTGYRMSRGGKFKENKNYFENNTSFYLRDIGMTHRMYYQLWLYYHLAGHKKDFYPTLFALLRQDPIVLRNGHNTESALKFVRKVCQAANEDLTDFFEFWGFFKPIENLYIGDYTSYTVTYTQEDIDAVKAEIAKYPKKNTQILFIDDRIQPTERFDINAPKGAMRPRHEGGTFVAGEYGDVGQFSDYAEGSMTPGNYSYLLMGTSITLTGEGGVGFVIKDKEGNVVTYSNAYNFDIPAELATDGFIIEVVNADGTRSEVKDVVETGDESQRLAALRQALSLADTYLALSDETGKKVGWYPTEKLSELVRISQQANAAIDAEEAANYSEYTRALNNEIQHLINSGAMTMIRPDATYSLQNCRPNMQLFISSNSSGVISAASSGVLSTAQWAFVPSSTEGRYKIQNKSTKKYIDAVPRSATISGKASSNSDGLEFTLNNLGGGRFGVQVINGDGLHLDAQKKVVGWWDFSGEGNQWIIVEGGEISEISKDEISQLVEDTKAYVATMATCEYADESIVLQTTSTSGAGYISTNYQEPNKGPIGNLVDGKKSTDFCSRYTENAKTATTYHHLLVNLGAGKTVNNFSFSYTTANDASMPKPTEIVVSGGTSATQLVEIKTFRSTDTVNPLPSAQTGQDTFESGILVCPKAYRYIRFSVRNTNATEPGTYPNFALSEFGMTNRNLSVTLDKSHAALESSLVSNCVLLSGSTETMLSNPTHYSIMDFNQAYSDLKAAYDKLQNAEITGIGGIEADVAESKSAAVYDLSGRRVAAPAQGGVYVVGGKKVLVK